MDRMVNGSSVLKVLVGKRMLKKVFKWSIISTVFIIGLLLANIASVDENPGMENALLGDENTDNMGDCMETGATRGDTSSGWITDQGIASTSFGSVGEPSIATDYNGNLYCAYESWSGIMGSHYYISVKKSTDSGLTWTSFASVSSSSSDYKNPDIAVDVYSGYIYVVYERHISTSDLDIWLLRISSSGTTANYGIATGSLKYQNPVITAEYQHSSANYIYVAYEYEVTTDNINLYVVRSTNDGVSWGAWGDWGGSDAFVYHQADITNADDNVYLVYRGGSNFASNCDINFTSKTRSGSTWSATYTVYQGSGDSSYPTIATLKDDSRLFVAFRYQSGSTTAIYYEYKTTSWSSTYSLVSSSADNIQYPVLSADYSQSRSITSAGNFHIIYLRTSSGTTTVRYRKYTSSWTSSAIVNNVNPSTASLPAITTNVRSSTYYPCVVFRQFSAFPISSGIYYTTPGRHYVFIKDPIQTWGSITIDGTVHSSSSTEYASFPAGTSHSVSVSNPDTSGDTRYSFTTWSGGSTSSITSITVNAIQSTTVQTYTANYQLQYKLTANNGGHGTTSPNGYQWYDSGTLGSFSISPTTVAGTTGIRYVFTAWSGDSTSTSSSDTITMDEPKTVTANWKTQYNLTVNNGGHGTASGTGWYDSGSTGPFSITPTTVAGSAGTQYLFVAWSGDSTSSSASSSVIMSSPKTVTATWQTQYYLTVNDGGHGTASGTGWYNSGSSGPFSISPTTVAGPVGTQYVFTSWSGDSTSSSASSSVTMSAPKTVTATWETQYYLTVDDGGHGTASGTGWHASGSSAPFEVAPSNVSGPTGTRYTFNGWSGDSTASANATSITMDAPKAVTATWKTQFYLIVNQAGHGTTSGAGWHDSGSQAAFSITPSTVAGTAGTQYIFKSWSGDSTSTSASTFINMNGPKTVTAVWTTQYYLTVNNGGYGTTSGTGWHNSSTSAAFSVSPEIVPGVTDTRYIFDKWTGDSTATSAATSMMMDAPKDVTATWITQYYLTVNNGSHGTTTGSGWYAGGSSPSFSITETTVPGTTGTQYIFTGWSGDSTSGDASSMILLDAPKTVTATWKTQYYLDIISDHGSPTGEGWYDAGSEVEFSIAARDGNKFFIGWTGVGDGSYSGDLLSQTVTLSNPITQTATWTGIDHITVSPSKASLTKGEKQQFSATAYGDAEGTIVIPNLIFEWSVSSDIGSIDSGGNFSAINPGTCTVKAVVTGVGGKEGSAEVTISDSGVEFVLDHIKITPASATLYFGENKQFIAKAYTADEIELPGKTFTWSVDGDIGTFGKNDGIFTAGNTKANGFVKVSCEGKSASAPVSVIGPAPTIARIEIVPSNIIVQTGKTQQFIAKVFDDQNTELTSGFTLVWAVSSTELGSIDSSGLFTAGNTETNGKVFASIGEIKAEATVTVKKDISVNRIEIIPNSTTLPVGSYMKFIVVGYDQNENVIGGLDLVWSVIGDIGSINTEGNFTATTVGEGNIEVTSGDLSVKAAVTVTSVQVVSILIDPWSVDLAVGDKQTFTATAYDNANQVLEGITITWSVDGDIGTIDSSGVFTATNKGSGKILASADGIKNSVDIEITEESDTGKKETGTGFDFMNILLILIILIIVIVIIIFVLVKRKPKKKKSDLITKNCPKCGVPIEVPYSKAERVMLECPNCGKKGRLANPYLEEEEPEYRTARDDEPGTRAEESAFDLEHEDQVGTAGKRPAKGKMPKGGARATVTTPPKMKAAKDTTVVRKEIDHPILLRLEESATCNICLGVIKTGLPVIKCTCGKKYHDSCAFRVGACPTCDTNLEDYEDLSGDFDDDEGLSKSSKNVPKKGKKPSKAKDDDMFILEDEEDTPPKKGKSPPKKLPQKGPKKAGKKGKMPKQDTDDEVSF